jgi:hypothetical protein
MFSLAHLPLLMFLAESRTVADSAVSLQAALSVNLFAHKSSFCAPASTK